MEIGNTSVTGPLIAVGGVLLGWALKAQQDLVAWWIADARQYRRATYYLLKAYKALLDYDRATTYFRRDRPNIDDYYGNRQLAAFLANQSLELSAESTKEALDLLGQLSPTLAMDVHDSLNRISRVLEHDGAAVLAADPKAYAELVASEDYILAITVSDLKKALGYAASRSRSSIRVWLWLRRREGKTGRKEFEDGMERHRDLRSLMARIRDQGEPDRSTFGQPPPQNP